MELRDEENKADASGQAGDKIPLVASGGKGQAANQVRQDDSADFL